MQSGMLQRRVTIQQRTTGKDTLGQPLTTWIDVKTVWAAVMPLSGHKLMQAEALLSETTYEIVMRYHAGIQPRMRVLYGTKIFTIQNVIDQEERHRSLTLLCSEGMNDG